MKITGWILAAFLFAGTVFAQQGPPPGPPPGPRMDGKVILQVLKDYLNLSDSQVSSLTAVETAMRDALKPFVQELAAKTKALRDENHKAAPDAKVVAQLKKDIEGLRDQMKTQRANYQKQLLTYLNGDQLALLAKLEQVLKLQPVARAAVALNLIDAPDGPGGERFGLGGPMGPGMMMRRRGGN